MSISPETWKPVVGYEGLYEVSSLGRVLSHRGRMLKASSDGRYFHVCLIKDGKERNPLLHRVVLEAFVGPCPKGMQACHGDGDRSNNRLDNLRWDSVRANHADKRRHGTQPTRETGHHAAKLNISDIRRILTDKRSSLKIAPELGVSSRTIRKIRSAWGWGKGDREPRIVDVS